MEALTCQLYQQATQEISVHLVRDFFHLISFFNQITLKGTLSPKTIFRMLDRVDTAQCVLLLILQNIENKLKMNFSQNFER